MLLHMNAHAICSFMSGVSIVNAHQSSESNPRAKQAVARYKQARCMKAIALSDPEVGLRLDKQQPHAQPYTELRLESAGASILSPKCAAWGEQHQHLARTSPLNRPKGELHEPFSGWQS